MADYPKLLRVLKETKKRLESSEDSAFASKTTAEMIKIIDSNINNIQLNSTCNLKELEMLYGPTTSLQDTSYDNGWGQEFIELSSQLDKAIN